MIIFLFAVKIKPKVTLLECQTGSCDICLKLSSYSITNVLQLHWSASSSNADSLMDFS